VVGGIASLLTAMLAEAGFALVHVPGLAVNRARQGTTGGEHKSDLREARIADQVRTRSDLRPINVAAEVDVELRLLVGRRRELVTDQTRRIGRLRDLLASIHPGLERIVDPTQKASLVLLNRYVTPAEIRPAGKTRLVNHMLKTGHLPRPHLERLAEQALAVRERLARLDAELEQTLARHPDAAPIRSLPGIGTTLTAEFIAEADAISRFPTPDRLAAAAGLAPTLKQSGKVRYLRRANGGNKALKRVLHQSAFRSLNHPASRTFNARKHRERKRHHQAVIALARRRLDVLHAMLRTRQPYRHEHAKAA
jgi:transposase